MSEEDSSFNDLAEEIIARLHEFTNDEDGGIPGLKRLAEESGRIIKIEFTVTTERNNTELALQQLGIDLSLLTGESGAESVTLEDVRMMGLCLDDMKGIVDMHQDDIRNMILDGMRQRATGLSPKKRNWMSGYIPNRFPELAIDFHKNQLDDDTAWLAKVEEIIAVALQFPNWIDILGDIFGNMIRLENK